MPFISLRGAKSETRVRVKLLFVFELKQTKRELNGEVKAGYKKIQPPATAENTVCVEQTKRFPITHFFQNKYFIFKQWLQVTLKKEQICNKCMQLCVE